MTYPSSIIDVSDSELWDFQDGINGYVAAQLTHVKLSFMQI